MQHVTGGEHQDGDRGALIFGVRKDEATKRTEIDGLANEEGQYTALEVDEEGYLRVRLKASDSETAASIVKTPSLEDALKETNSLLRRLTLAAELYLGYEVPDPGK